MELQISVQFRTVGSSDMKPLMEPHSHLAMEPMIPSHKGLSNTVWLFASIRNAVRRFGYQECFSLWHNQSPPGVTVLDLSCNLLCLCIFSMCSTCLTCNWIYPQIIRQLTLKTSIFRKRAAALYRIAFWSWRISICITDEYLFPVNLFFYKLVLSKCFCISEGNEERSVSKEPFSQNDFPYILNNWRLASVSQQRSIQWTAVASWAFSLFWWIPPPSTGISVF